MLSYIKENGSALDRTLRQAQPSLDELAAEAYERDCKRVVLSGVGSSYTAAWAAKYAFDNLVGLPTYVLPSTELSYYPALFAPETLAVVLSRSGERRFVIDALDYAQKAGAFTVAVTGAAGSLMAQSAARVILTSEGPEASFPKTKSVTAGIGTFLGLALALMGKANERADQFRASLALAPTLIDQAVEMASDPVRVVTETLLQCNRVIVAGTGGNSGAAMEMEVKLQESALVTTQWMDTGNLFHGPLCLLDDTWLVILLVTKEDAPLSSEAFRLVKSLGGRTLGLIPSGVRLETEPDYAIHLPTSPDRYVEALVYLPVLQLLAYHWTVAQGLDPDAPPGSDVILGALLPEGRLEPEAHLQSAT
jgi:fructoselysine-6-P-deglycase FrlB-like protein